MPALMEKRALGNHDVPIRCRLSEPRTAEVQKVTAASRAPDEIIARKKCRDPDDAARGGRTPGPAATAMGHGRWRRRWWNSHNDQRRSYSGK